MRGKENDKLILEEIKKLLITMHKGESLLITLNKIMDTIGGARYVEEKKFLYLLQGLYMDKMGRLPDIAEDKDKIEGFNEAAEENNFAIKLAISAIMGEE